MTETALSGRIAEPEENKIRQGADIAHRDDRKLNVMNYGRFSFNHPARKSSNACGCPLQRSMV